MKASEWLDKQMGTGLYNLDPLPREEQFPLDRIVMRPGPGWKQLKGPVWEHESGVRIHVGGLILRDANGEIKDNERAHMTLLHKLIKINGGNRKRGLMAFALNF